MMSRAELEPRDPVRKQRAELVRAATVEEWRARPGGKLEKSGRDGLRLAVAKAPEFIVDAGEVVGVDAWVQLFDESGRELPIDPHRRIINPPTVPRAGVQMVDTGKRENGQPVMDRQVTADPTAAFWEAVWDSVGGAPNPKGWRTRGTVTTIFAATTDAFVNCTSTTYSTARSGGGTLQVFDNPNLVVGQDPPTNYICRCAFASFDTSAISDGDAVSDVLLEMYLGSDFSTTEFTIEVRDFDWGASVTTADYIPGANLGSSPLVASLATSGMGATGAYKSFASEPGFSTVTNIKTGTVHLLLHSDRQRLGNAPTTQESVIFASADTSGTTQDPKLTITHAAANAVPFFTSRPNRIWRLG